MNAYWQILRALTRRNWLFAGLLLCIPLTVRMVGLYDPNPIASMVTLAIVFPAILWFTGGLLGNTAGALLHHMTAPLVPAYHRKVLTVVILQGLGLWSLVMLYYAGGGYAVDKIAWLRWAPLLSYGLLGLGFIGGLLAPGLGNASPALSWSPRGLARRTLLALLWVLPFAVISSQTLRDWLTLPLSQEQPGVTPLSVACLLVGPLSWFSIVQLLAPLQPPATAVKRTMAEHVRSGAGGTWGLPVAASWLHRRSRPRIEFLVFQPMLLNMVIAPLIIVAVFVALQALIAAQVGFTITHFLKVNLNTLLIAVFIIPIGPIHSGPIDLPRLGQGLLLPGQFRRPSLPVQLFRIMLTVWIGGAMVALAPLAGLADAIVDLVSTGGTLKANKLVACEHIMDISSRLVVNQASLKVKRETLQPIIDAFAQAVEK